MYTTVRVEFDFVEGGTFTTDTAGIFENVMWDGKAFLGVRRERDLAIGYIPMEILKGYKILTD
jgi:hypothetical protein